MTVKMVRLTRFTQGLPIVDNAGRAVPSFITVLNAALKQIEAAFNGIIDAQNSANAAQTTADGANTTAASAQASAASANTTAASAVTIANSKLSQTDADGRYVRQSQTATWAAPTGTESRTAYVEYVPPTISATPTQAEVQAVADALGDLSQHMVALISDLQAVNVLKH